MDEFNKNDVKEFYEVDEAKVFEAVEYYPVKEVAKSPNEIKDAPEDNSDNEKKVSEEVRATDRPEVDELRERIRSLNSDGSHGTPVTGGETTAAATTGGAASSTGATVVASSASLAGVTIVAVAAVAVIGSNVFNEPPKIASETITLGADYCLCEFELDRSTIKSNTEYSIILTDGVDTFKKDIDLSKSSQRLLFTGLKNDWSYRRQIVAKYNKAEVYYYDLSRIRTDNPKEPVAIFEFDVDIDTNEIDGTNTYNLDYSIYFSNKYGDVTNSYGEIIFNGSDAERKESIVNEEIDNNNFIKGRLENLKDNQELEFNAYSMYKDEMVLIGYEEFNVIYPDYFKTTPEYNSQYVFNSDSISNYTYDINSGSSFVINTGFDNSDDENDALKFDVYDVDNNLIDSVITQDSEITFDMDPMYNSGTIEMTPIKFKSSSSKNNTKALRKLRDDEEYYEYDKEAVIVPYSFDPVFEESSFEIYDDYFVFNGFYSKEDLDENNASFNLNITINYNDGTESKTINETINELMISHEGQYGDNKTKADIASIELLVSHENTNGKNIGLLRFVKDFSVDSVEFSDPVYNEYLGLPYEVTLEKGSELSSIHVEFESGMIEGTNLEDQIGVMEMFEITSPIVKGTFELYYVDRHGVYVQNTLPFDLKVLTSRLFNNILFTPNDNNFDFSFDYAGMTDLGDNYEVVIKTLDSDGNVINTYEDEFKSENESYEINRDLESNCNSVEVSISYINSTGGEAVIEPIETYNFILDAISATSDSVDLEIDDDGNVLIPYSVKEVEGYDLAYLTASFYDGTSEEIQVTDYEGYITITSLNANLLDGKLVATYKSKTTNDYMNIGYKYNMNLNSVINMDYFVPYSGSNQSVAVKYDVLINNKSVNMDLGLTALKRVGTGTDETIETVSINEARPSELDQKYLDILDEYYVVSLVDSSNTLIITANGFDDAIYNSIKTSSFTTVMSPDQVYSDFDNFNINESFSYNVINNDDGTTSYLFNTGFEEGEETTITHKQKFTFVYEDELGNKKSIVKYLDDNSDKTPKITLPTREYEIYYSIEALIDGIPYDVSKDKTSGFKEVDIDPSLVIVKDSGSIDINDNNLIIDYSFNLDCIDTDKSVYLLLNDNEYEIIYYDKTNSNVTIVSDTEYNYSINRSNYSIYVEVFDDNIISIKLTIKNKSYDSENDTIKLLYSFNSNKYISDLNKEYDLSLDPKDYSMDDCEVTLFDYDSTFNISVGQYYLRQYNIAFKNSKWNSQYDRILAEIEFSDGTIITKDPERYGDPETLNIYFDVPYYASEFSVTIKYYKLFNDNKYFYKTEYLGTTQVDALEFTSEEVINNGDGTFTISGNVNDTSMVTYMYVTEYRNDTRTYTNYITGGSYSLEYDSDNHFEFTFTPDSETDFIILGYNSDYCIHYLPINMFKTTINDNILIEYDAPLDTSDGLKISYYTADEDKYIIEPLGAISVKDLDGNSLTLQNSSSDPENSWRVENKECIIEIVVNIDDNTSITYKQKVNLD